MKKNIFLLFIGLNLLCSCCLKTSHNRHQKTKSDANFFASAAMRADSARMFDSITAFDKGEQHETKYWQQRYETVRDSLLKDSMSNGKKKDKHTLK